jgi:leucyl aminopeptidase
VVSVKLTNRGLAGPPVDAVVLAAFADRAGPVVDELGTDLLAGLGVDIDRVLRRGSPAFGAEAGETCSLVLPDRAPTVVVVGLGAGAADRVTAEALREGAMAAAAATRGFERIATTMAGLGAEPAEAVRACVEGLLVGGYQQRAEHRLARLRAVSLVLPPARRAGDATLQRAVRTAQAAAEATAWVRELVERPGGELGPAALAEQIRERAGRSGVQVRVWTGRRLAARGFGATLGVGGGSPAQPVVVELRSGSDTGRVLGLAGKGITFDSGGLDLKRDPDEIAWMKSDMAGAAAVAAAVCAAADLGPSRRVHAVLPLAENLPGPGALRPGDVVTHPDGRRTEVVDTDSEGRLVLADAIAYLARSGADRIVDVGTLTDGGGLGHLRWGCWGNSDDLVGAVLRAGATAGEPGWHLPLLPRYRELFRSGVADLRNCAREVPDTAMMAATYLSTFADGVAWAHIDNGGTAYLPGALAPWPEGATGSPTRALLELIGADLKEYTEYK